MKTLAVRKTTAGNYIVYYPGIFGQQSHGNEVLIYDLELNPVAEKTYHDIALWHEKCEVVVLIGGVKPGDEKLMFKKAMDLRITGYTTASMIKSGNGAKLLPPLNAVAIKIPKPKKNIKPTNMETPDNVGIADNLQD